MIHKINDHIFRCLRWIVVVSVTFLIGILFLQVVLRYVFSFSFGEIDELSRYIFIWTVFIGIGLGYREKAHLGVTAFINKLSSDKKKLVLNIISIVSMAFFVLVFIAGCQMIKLTMNQRSSTLLIPMGYIYASVPVGAVLCFLTQFESFLYKKIL